METSRERGTSRRKGVHQGRQSNIDEENESMDTDSQSDQHSSPSHSNAHTFHSVLPLTLTHFFLPLCFSHMHAFYLSRSRKEEVPLVKVLHLGKDKLTKAGELTKVGEAEMLVKAGEAGEAELLVTAGELREAEVLVAVGEV